MIHSSSIPRTPRHGLKYGPWSSFEDSWLRQNYNSASKEHILSSLSERSWGSILVRATRYGLRRTRCWTKDDDEQLTNLYPCVSLKKLCSAFPERSISSLRHRSIVLGVKARWYNQRSWSIEETRLLRNLWPKASHAVLKKAFPKRTYVALNKRALAIGLSRHIDNSGSRNGFYGRHHSAKTKAKIARKISAVTSFRKLSKDPEFQKKRRAALYAKPNKEERLLGSILEGIRPGGFKYVGEGSYLIDGLNPDFISIDGSKKVVELFGRSFHDPKACAWHVPYRSTASGRRRVFRDKGYRLLIVWDDDLPMCRRAKLIRHIRTFLDY